MENNTKEIDAVSHRHNLKCFCSPREAISAISRQELLSEAFLFISQEMHSISAFLSKMPTSISLLLILNFDICVCKIHRLGNMANGPQQV